MNLNAGEKFCFNTKSDLSKARSKLTEILHPSDEVFINKSSNCFIIEAPGRRSALYAKIINPFSSSALGHKNFHEKIGQGRNLVPEMCRFEVREMGHQSENVNNVSLGKKSKIKSGNSKEELIATRSLVVSQGRQASLTINDEELKVECRITSNGYNVTLSISNKLSTAIFIAKGQEVEIASVVENLKNSGGIKVITNSKLDDSKIESTNKTKKKNNKYFLKIK